MGSAEDHATVTPGSPVDHSAGRGTRTAARSLLTPPVRLGLSNGRRRPCVGERPLDPALLRRHDDAVTERESTPSEPDADDQPQPPDGAVPRAPADPHDPPASADEPLNPA
jgi:hypothetical protein